MPSSYLKSFQLRQYECDANGHLNNANYVRFLHEATLEAMQGVRPRSGTGTLSDLAWYASELFVDYIQPARYGDTLRVQAQVIEQQKMRVLWGYEFQKDGALEPIARAQVRYGLVDPVGGRWSAIPEEMKEAFEAAESRLHPVESIQYPATPPPPPGAFTGNWRVGWRDISQDQTLQIASYLDYLLDFVLQAAAACGWTFQHTLEQGLALVVRRKWLKIFEPVKYGDELRLSTWLSPMKRASVTRHIIIERAADGVKIGEAHTLWVCVDIKNGRPVRIPASWEDDFKPQISVE